MPRTDSNPQKSVTGPALKTYSGCNRLDDKDTFNKIPLAMVRETGKVIRYPSALLLLTEVCILMADPSDSF